MTYITPTEAADLACPLSRITPHNSAKCIGPNCILWRWKPLRTSDPRLVAAIKREKVLLADEHNKSLTEGETKKSPESFLKQATQNVCLDPEGYGVTPERGYCGLGAQPT
jgi:hypothetical protein